MFYKASETILLIGVIVCAICMVIIAKGVTTIATPSDDIILPKEVVAIETNKEQLFNTKAECFHLVKAPDGTPDYVLGACPD